MVQNFVHSLRTCPNIYLQELVHNCNHLVNEKYRLEKHGRGSATKKTNAVAVVPPAVPRAVPLAVPPAVARATSCATSRGPCHQLCHQPCHQPCHQLCHKLCRQQLCQMCRSRFTRLQQVTWLCMWLYHKARRCFQQILSISCEKCSSSANRRTHAAQVQKGSALI